MGIRLSVRHVLRRFRTSWRFAILTILTLGIGFAGVATIFSVLSSVVFRPLPFRDSDRLVTITQTVPFMGSGPQVGTLDEFRRWQQSPLLDRLAAINTTELILPGDHPGNHGAELLSGSRVTPDFFQVLGVTPLLGRGFHADDAVPGHEQVVVLSYDLWERRFAKDPSIVGRSIRVSNQSLQVLGVMPPHFDFPRLADVGAVMPFAAARSEFWVPLVITQAIVDQNFYSFYLLGRMQAGASRAQAAAAFQISALQSLRYIVDRNPTYREPLENLARQIKIQVTPLKESMAMGVRSGLLLLFGAAASLLLLVLFNLGNLLLASHANRLRDYAIRQALGGSRTHLFFEAFFEQGVLLVFASTLGLLLCSWAIGLLRTLAENRIPRLHELSVSPSTIVLLLGLSVVTAIVFGGLPLLVLPRSVAWLPSESRSTTGDRSSQKIRSTLMVAEIAVSMVLLVSAGLLAASFSQVLRVPPGFDPSKLLTFSVSSDPSLFADKLAMQANERATLRFLRALPGVESASSVNVLPLTGDYSIHGVGPVGKPLNKDFGAEARWIDSEYFHTMRIPLLAGRVLREGDSGNVAVINQKMAQLLWPETDAMGRQFSDNGGAVPIRVVGIVGNVHSGLLETEPLMQFYRPSSAAPGYANSFAVRTRVLPLTLLPGIQQSVSSLHANQAVSGVQTMEQITDRITLERRFESDLLLGFASAALFLSALGLFAVASLSVARQLREFGIRVALGASGADVLWLQVTRTGRLVLAGLLIGLALSLLMHRILQTFLFGVSSLDIPIYAIAGGVLTTSALLAIVIPALRALRLDPALVLRDE